MAQDRFYATGKRKNAIARVWLTPGTGKVIVNKMEAIRVMNELKFLRDKKSVTTKEMIDSIITAYAKGDDNIRNIMVSLNKVLTGQ